jgi:hypothetical protein
MIAGTQMYLISRTYAEAVINEWYNTIDFAVHKCGRLDDGLISSETPMNIMLKRSGLIAYPMLGIESIMLRSVRDPERPEKLVVRYYWFKHFTNDFDHHGMVNKLWCFLFGDYKHADIYYWQPNNRELTHFLNEWCGTVTLSETPPDRDYDILLIKLDALPIEEALWRLTACLKKSKSMVYVEIYDPNIKNIIKMILKESKHAIQIETDTCLIIS